MRAAYIKAIFHFNSDPSMHNRQHSSDCHCNSLSQVHSTAHLFTINYILTQSQNKKPIEDKSGLLGGHGIDISTSFTLMKGVSYQENKVIFVNGSSIQSLEASNTQRTKFLWGKCLSQGLNWHV
jgi:hypothetical protein